MNKAASHAVAELLESPFFVVAGPGGTPIACQWTCYAFGRAQSHEFEILCVDRPDKMGCLFGLFDPASATFRMRPEVAPGTWKAVKDGCQDLEWRGSMDDLVETGHDLREAEDGGIAILDPEAPAEEDDLRPEMLEAA